MTDWLAGWRFLMAFQAFAVVNRAPIAIKVIVKREFPQTCLHLRCSFPIRLFERRGQVLHHAAEIIPDELTQAMQWLQQLHSPQERFSRGRVPRERTSLRERRV